MLFFAWQLKHVLSDRRIISSLLLLHIAVLSFAQQWYYSPVPRGRHVNAVKILDSIHIVAGGGNEFNDSLKDVFLSGNKGLSWGSSSNAISPWVTSIAFSDALHGIGVGYTGTILKTSNGAISWANAPTPINRQFNKVFYLNAQTAFIVGGSVPRSDTLQTILKSTDSGNTWTVQRDRQGFWLKDIYFTDNNHGIAVGDNGTILKTTNGGLSWNSITSPVMRDFRAVKFINNLEGYIVGGKNYLDAIDSFSTILRTTNGGTNWTILKDDTAGILTDIKFINSSTGYICGDKATLLKTTNGGLNWTKIIIPNSLSTDYFNSLDFLNDHLGIVSGKYGQTYIYTTSQLPEVYTLNTQPVDVANFILQGAVNTHGEGALYTFYSTTDSIFTFSPFEFPQNVKSNFIKTIKHTASGLIPDTTYHYYLEAKTFAGKVQGDTLSFITSLPDFSLKTLPATDVSPQSASLNGEIDKFPFQAAISFEWGLTPSFGNEIPAIPTTVNDTFRHTFSATVSNLLPDIICFFRLKATYNSKTYYGNTLSFYTVSAFLQTLPATIITDTSALLSGRINKFKVPVTLSFEYGRTIALENEMDAIPSLNNDSLSHHVFAAAKNLFPLTPYFFRLKGQTDLSDYYGNIFPFTTGYNYGKFETGDATHITNTSARLNGWVSKIYDSVRLSFEYGTTPALGNTIYPLPLIVSDSAEHNIIADLSGLLTNQVYYYRLDGTSHGMAIRGKVRQFFTGESDIPNWDFQFWNMDTIQVPATWSFFGENFRQVPGHSGNYALKLSEQAVALNGMISDGKNGDLVSGVAISTGSVPDSVSFYSNYAIEPGDTAFAIFQMRKEGHLLFRNFYPISGNSNGVFKRLSYKIQYDSLAVADSLTFGFITTNAFSHPPGPARNNFLVVDDIALQPENISFENSGLEDWYTSVLDIPLSWFNLRYFGLIRNYPDSNHMVSRVFFNDPDDFAAEVKNVHIPFWGVAEGAISSPRAIIDDRKIGFPVKGRHVSLNGYYKFFPLPGDTLQVYIDLKKNGINIGNTSYYIAHTAYEFTPFTVPIYYNNDTDIPDSAYIDFRIYNPVPAYGSRFVLDKLSFDGFVTSAKPELLEAGAIKVYPNPTRDFLVVENEGVDINDGAVFVFNMNGLVVKTVLLSPAKSFTKIDVGDLAPGFYVLTVKKDEKTYSKKIIIQ